MMDAPADSYLESYYADSTNRARRFVASRYALEECSPSSPDYPGREQDWREVWSVRVSVSDEPQDLILAVPHTFPDDLPKIYLPAQTVEAIKQIPHLDVRRFLCTFDEVAAKPNADDPGGVALAVLGRAVKVFGDDLSGDNRSDYSEELQAYWALDSDILSLSLVEPDTAVTGAVMLQLQPSWRGYSYLFAQTEDAGKEWLRAVGCASKLEAQKVPFLHLQTLGDPPMPSTNGDIYRLLRRQDDDSCLKRLIAHLQRSQRPSAVLFSIPTVGGARMLGAWWHPKVVHEVNRGPDHNRRHQHVVPGFRAGSNSVAAAAELSVRHQKAKIVRSVIERVDRARLFARTAGTARTAVEHPVNMIGCGSLGSITASALAQGGLVNRLRIVDPQKLEPENVQRHYCGMSDIEEYKAEATARKLRAHLPHVECEPQTRDVLDVLRTSPAVFTPTSLTVVTLGDIAVERRLNRLYKSGVAFGDAPLCFMWVEPHLFAGHALFLRRNRAGCFECAFDENFHFRRRVLANPSSFSRREAGCQSTFVPYSGADAAQFVAAATRFLINSFESPENRIFTWIGDIEEARRTGAQLEPEWEHASPFSAHITVLTPSKSCPVCSRND
jgi:hypothetical protein